MRGCVCAVGLLLPFLASEVGAQDVEAPQVRVARLVRRLGADSYADRVRARDELAELGPLTRPQLEAAARDGDLETALHARQLLQRIDAASLWQPSLVTGPAGSSRVSAILATVAEQAGNRLLLGEQYGPLQDAPLDWDAAPRPFWQALDDVCQKSGNQYRPLHDSAQPGLVVVAGDLGQFPTAYAGPVRATVTSARRQFIEEYDYRVARSDCTHAFQLNLQMMWEDRFRLAAYRSQIELVDARAEGGARLSMTQAAGTNWNVVGGGARQVAMTLRLTPPPVACRRLDCLRLRWGLIAVGPMESVELELTGELPRRHVAENIELTVEHCQCQGTRCEVAVIVNRDLVVPEPQDVLFQENTFELLDQAGRPYRLQGQTNHLADQGARIRLNFATPASDSAAAKLRVHYPRLRSQHDLEIVFDYVPLPTARPE